MLMQTFLVLTVLILWKLDLIDCASLPSSSASSQKVNESGIPFDTGLPNHKDLGLIGSNKSDSLTSITQIENLTTAIGDCFDKAKEILRQTNLIVNAQIKNGTTFLANSFNASQVDSTRLTQSQNTTSSIVPSEIGPQNALPQSDVRYTVSNRTETAPLVANKKVSGEFAATDNVGSGRSLAGQENVTVMGGTQTRWDAVTALNTSNVNQVEHNQSMEISNPVPQVITPAFGLQESIVRAGSIANQTDISKSVGEMNSSSELGPEDGYCCGEINGTTYNKTTNMGIQAQRVGVVGGNTANNSLMSDNSTVYYGAVPTYSWPPANLSLTNLTQTPLKNNTFQDSAQKQFVSPLPTVGSTLQNLTLNQTTSSTSSTNNNSQKVVVPNPLNSSTLINNATQELLKSYNETSDTGEILTSNARINYEIQVLNSNIFWITLVVVVVVL
ncbi:hypothetical protein CROQUDRAFT_671434 [Cronartium quercuum f. sp. fusiforme G11]|uniref:Uncharacterized protein n=1 Tax=Cronartium quercuum f. sp. fusiforme G11 TaxID=708437 RepID=A0A9P6NKX3_9BASI|nr:hypothetical protein CROQUDRAFT_671434 [Cronartium quercuum f. sp. fusiforme G11]